MLPANKGTTAQLLCEPARTDKVHLKVGLCPCLMQCLTQCQLDCRQGRKPLFLVCGSIMAAMQIATGILTAVTFTGVKIPTTAGIIMIVFICIFVSQFAASWGPLGWLVPSEMHPLQTRTAGQVRSPSMSWICIPDALPCVKLPSAMDAVITLPGCQRPLGTEYDRDTAEASLCCAGYQCFL